MKILVTSDLHINDWIPFSTLDEFGRPSRLLDYLKLAHELSHLAKDQECDAIIIAGDLSECSIQRPMVHDVIGDFLRICSRHTEVHLIHGQHDCDSKHSEAMGMNSILREICKDLNNENHDIKRVHYRKKVHYYDSPTLTEINGKSVFFQSWTQNHELMDQKADVFVGHGIVTGCTNLDGYIFINGFKKEDLFDRYKLSIIGDIHKRQYYHNENKDRVIIQPGTPIQNTWKDFEDCGIHIIHFNEEIDIEFLPIHELLPNTFHRFTYDYEGELTDLIHSRPKIKVKKKEETKKSLELKRDNSIILSTCLELIEKETSTINKSLVVQFLNDLFLETKLASNKVISNAVINSIQAENFLSIDTLSLDFNEFPHSCVISGQNGCVDKDTEFLTEFGWKPISEYKPEDKVGVYHSSTNEVKWESPLDFIKYPKDELTLIQAHGIDMCLSDEHKVIYWTTKESKNPSVLPLFQVKERHNKSKQGWYGKLKTTFKTNRIGIDISEGELRLQVAVMADGRVVREGKDNYTQMRFSKERKYKRLIELCNKFNLKYKDLGAKYCEKYKNKTEYQVIVWPKWKDKSFDVKYWNCSQNQLEIIADEVKYWDSSILKRDKGNSSIVYYTNNKGDADFIQYCFSATGLNTSIYLDDKNYKVSGNYSGKGFRCFANKDRKLEFKSYKTLDGFNYCFTVSTGMFIIRRNNKIVITGNSGKTTIPEAIYWCLTGSTTKTINISDILNSYKDSISCVVKLNVTINNQELTIVRERNNKTSSLYFIDKDQNVIKRGSIRETQEEIYNLLGLKEWQIFMFSYFSAERTSMFAGLGDSAKNDLISQIVGLDFIEAMRDASKEKRSELQTSASKLEGNLSECESNVNSLKRKLEKLKAENNNNKPEIEAKISKKKIELISTSEELTNIKSELVGIPDTLDLPELTKHYYSLQSKYENSENKRVLIETKLSELKKELKSTLAGVCPTCNQEFHNEEFIFSLKSKISEQVLNLKNIPDVLAIKEELTEIHDTLIKKEELNKRSRILTNKEQEAQNRINSIKLTLSELDNELLKESFDDKLILDVENEIKEKESQFESIVKSMSDLTSKLNSWKYLETSLFKKNGDLIKELNKQGSKFIQSCIEEVTTNTGVIIKIDNDLKLFGEFYNKTTVPYDLMSSGQKRLTDIILMVSMNNLFSKIYNLKDGVLGLSVYDEILSFLDDKYIEIAKQVVDQSISKKILIITHDNNLINMYDSKIIVSMSKNGSVYTKSWS